MVNVYPIFALVASVAASIQEQQQRRHIPRQATEAPASTTAPEPEVTVLSECHLHDTNLYCFAGTAEYSVDVTPTATADIPAQYTDCHNHGIEMFCVAPDGSDVEVHATEPEEGHGHDSESEEGHDHDTEAAGEAPTQDEGCHYHNGVQHCPGNDPPSAACSATPHDYNVGLRVGLLFVILVSSAVGVFGPIFLNAVMPNKLGLVIVVLKQFGTGIIVSTAFVHLLTHAAMMFGNECVGELAYEATTAAIVMAGLFLSFLVEYVGQRVVQNRTRTSTSSRISTEVVSILVMEAGICFHSILIGLTLVVTPDNGFIPLFVVILFHQMFEGIALGSRIAAVRTPVPNAGSDSPAALMGENDKIDQSNKSAVVSDTESAEPKTMPLPLSRKVMLASAFSLITPIGMAIGIGALNRFNGNDGSTLMAIGTLDALSAGILIWVGLVEMLANDWMAGGSQAHGHGHGPGSELASASVGTVMLGMSGLIVGLVLMSVLGKWA